MENEDRLASVCRRLVAMCPGTVEVLFTLAQDEDGGSSGKWRATIRCVDGITRSAETPATAEEAVEVLIGNMKREILASAQAAQEEADRLRRRVE